MSFRGAAIARALQQGVAGTGSLIEKLAARRQEEERYKTELAARNRAEGRAVEATSRGLAIEGFTRVDPAEDARRRTEASNFTNGGSALSAMPSPVPGLGMAAQAAGQMATARQAQAEKAPTVTAEGVQYRLDPSLSVSAQNARYEREQEEARLGAAEEALAARYVAGGMKPEDAQLRAHGDVRKFDTSYKPFTREQGFADVRESGEIEDTFDSRRQGRSHTYQMRQQAASQAFQARHAAAERENRKGERWQTIQTADGYMQVDPVSGQTRPLLGAGGEPLTKGVNIPGSARKALAANASQLSVLDRAIRGVEENPGAVGFWRGRSTLLDDQFDPRGNTTRANIADIGSLVLHDRSGAAVTASEFPRLRPFIPSASDSRRLVLDKLRRMREVIADEDMALQESFGIDTSGGGADPFAGRRDAAPFSLSGGGAFTPAPSRSAGPTRDSVPQARTAPRIPLLDRMQQLDVQRMNPEAAKRLLRAEGYNVP